MNKRLIVFFVLIVVFTVTSFIYPIESVDNTDIWKKETVFVNKVIDGDTIRTDVGDIRLLGINCPEKGKPLYDESKRFLSQIENQTVEILRDKEDLDKYGRKLRYIFYNDRLINVEILENGYATSYLLDGLKYKTKLTTAENFAIDNNLNLWEKSEDGCAECIKLIELNYEEEYFILENLCDFGCNLNGWEVKDDANHFFDLNPIKSGESKKVESDSNVWNNNGDRFFLRDGEGKLVIFYSY